MIDPPKGLSPYVPLRVCMVGLNSSLIILKLTFLDLDEHIFYKKINSDQSTFESVE